MKRVSASQVGLMTGERRKMGSGWLLGRDPAWLWPAALLFLPLFPGLARTATDHVIALTAEIFEEAVATHHVLLVEFYAPWCGHCQRLAPQFQRAAAILSTDGVSLAKVDATEEVELAKQFSVQAYPTLKFFRDGSVYDYEGPHTAEGIAEYMRSVARPDWEPPQDLVLVLTQQNFTQVVSGDEPVLVEFYAPWCGHCKRLAPDYERAAFTLHQMRVPVSLAKVDATVEMELADKFEVKGYPTLKLFRGGAHKEYRGTRETNAIVDFMMEQALPSSHEISSYKKLNILRREAIDPLIFTFASSEENPAMRAHLTLADEARGHPVQFAHSFSQELASRLQLGEGQTAIFTPKWIRSQHDPEMKTHQLEEPETLEELLAAARPLVGLRVKGNEMWFSSQPLLVLYCDVEDMDYVRKMVAEIAREFSQLAVAVSNRDEYQTELENLGVGESSEDVIVGIWIKGTERYTLAAATTQTIIRDFVESYLSGTLERVVRSQPPPKKLKDGEVTVVVGSTFQSFVLDPAQDVLVEFYAPWCGHCKTLEPVYQQLARRYKNDGSVLIAKFDATENDAPDGFQFSSFPALFFVPAGPHAQPIPYFKQERELHDLVAFVDAHRTSEPSHHKDEL